MQKRGQIWLLYLALSVLMIGAALVFLLADVKSIKEDTIREEMYFARDLALTTSAVYAAPGDLILRYKDLTVRRDFSVLSRGEPAPVLDFFFRNYNVEAGVQRYPFAGDLYFGDLLYNIAQPKSLTFVNDGFGLNITNTEVKDLTITGWRYPQVNTYEKYWTSTKKIVVVPEGNELANFLYGAEGNFKSSDPDPDIYLRIIDIPESGGIRATISSSRAPQSRKLAALIINQVLKTNKDITSWIDVSDSSELLAKEAGLILYVNPRLVNKQQLYNIFRIYYETE